MATAPETRAKAIEIMTRQLMKQTDNADEARKMAEALVDQAIAKRGG